jgi:hypothetical protein
MPVQTRDTLKQWFQTGDYPTQAQFYDLLDSMLLSGEVTLADVVNLVTTLQGKADKASFDAFYQGERIAYNANAVYVIPDGYLLEKMIVLPGVDANIRTGNTNGAEDVNPEYPFSAATGEVLVLNLYAKAARTIYINGLPAGSAIIYFKRLVKTA